MTDQPRVLTVREVLGGELWFRVPIYQRAYAWEKDEIETLVRDVVSSLGRSAYYIGSLVLHRVRGAAADGPVYDVIDGQQRLTTLYLVLTHPLLRSRLQRLDQSFSIRGPLIQFEEREPSTLDLRALARDTTTGAALPGLRDDGIRAAVDVIGSLLADEGRLRRIVADQQIHPEGSPTDLVDQVLSFLLDGVRLVVTGLPAETDLNHYFEVMNTRGRQLEKHEVVKARLLSTLGDDIRARGVVSRVWDACSDFSRHVQAGFAPDVRSRIFGDPDGGRPSSDGWGRFEVESFDQLLSCMDAEGDAMPMGAVDLDTVLGQTSAGSESGQAPVDDGAEDGRYKAIIDFPNFLLHVLRLHVGEGSHVALDDKTLVEQFGRMRGPGETKDFIFRLLRTRYLFDRYVIKPKVEPGADPEANWVLHEVHCPSSEQGKKKLSPRQPFDERQTRQILMAQAMFQVTHQRRVYKEFLFTLLGFLGRTWASHGTVSADRLIDQLHLMANGDLARLRPAAHGVLDAGTAVPHFALNLLDYKLWLAGERGEAPEGLDVRTLKEAGFRFAYRTSIEHFFPQASAGSAGLEDVVDNFGNLCLMTRVENSRRSDHDPAWKVQRYGKTDQSLKFHCMCDLQQRHRAWGREQIEEHGRLMRQVLLAPFPTDPLHHGETPPRVTGRAR